jgi:photosystem II stability/assembly factor-like uncharacterized protein
LPKFKAVEIHDANHAWIIAYGKGLLHTQDGGKKWEIIAQNQSGSLNRISFITPQEGWAVDKQGNILKTIDGGRLWYKISSLQYNNKESAILIINIKFTDKLHGWIVDSTSIWRTEDGGLNWETQYPFGRITGSNQHILSCSFLNNKLGWLGGDGGKIYSTKDGGSSWLVKILASSEIDFDDINFISKDTGWVLNYSGSKIYKTQDGGNSWQPVIIHYSDEGISINSVYFINKDIGWAAGQISPESNQWDNLPINMFGSAVVLSTSDGGLTWLPIRAGVKESSFDSIFFADSNNGWLFSRRNI